MLNLPERVSKRARLECGDFDVQTGLCDRLISTAELHNLDIFNNNINQCVPRIEPLPLRLNLNPAGSLTSTPTRVDRVPPLILSTKNNVSATSPWPNLEKASYNLSLGPESPQLGTSAGINVQCGASEANLSFTWDDFMASNGDDIGGDVDDTSSSENVAYNVDFSALTKEHILRAAINAAMGFESALVLWNEPKMQLCLSRSVENSKFSDYLALFARCGSYICRLRRAARRIRYLVKDNSACRTALALAASIEFELGGFIRVPDFCTSLVGLYSRCFRVHALAFNLAELVGCADLEEGGRLLRVPSATTLLERAYERALLQKSHKWLGGMLWQLVSATLTPWLEQLSFVVGITEPLVPRKAFRDMQSIYFPEIFVSVNEELGCVTLEESLVPRFMSLDVAQAAVQCYNILVLFGIKGYDVIALAHTDLHPLSIKCNSQRREAMLASFSLADQQPSSVEDGVHSVLKALNSPANNQGNKSLHEDSYPPSIESEVWRAFVPVLVRSTELNVVAKQAVFSELNGLRNVVVGVYLLGDGVFWSVFADLVDAMFSNWDRAATFIPAMDALVSDIYPGVSFIIDPKTRFSLQLMCDFPKVIETAFTKHCLRSFQAAFSTLLRVHFAKQDVKFALLATDAIIIAREIDTALNNPACGLQEVVQAFENVEKLASVPDSSVPDSSVI